MTPREEEIGGFLASAGWGASTRAPLAGDASNRRYLRLALAERRAVLMDAPPERGEYVGRFALVARHLAGRGLSAPEVMAEDLGRGLLLLEDLGDRVYAGVLREEPSREAELYGPAVDVILALAEAPVPDWVVPFRPDMVELAASAFDWYGGGGRGEFVRAFEAALAALPERRAILMLRDYHAENLIWLPEREGVARVGLLDFQDARASHPVYDLVSLLADARRDVGADTVAAMGKRFREGIGMEAEEFDAAAAVIGAQRHLRILGVFARLCLVGGKAGYVEMIPRVWGHLMRALEHPALAEVAPIVRGGLPVPDAGVLEELRARCGTVRAP